MKEKQCKNQIRKTAGIHRYGSPFKLGDWRGELPGRLRRLILESALLAEEWKWDTAVWSHKGLVCAGGVFKDHVKLNFFMGASLNDPKGLFNAGLDARATRSIDFHEGGGVNEADLKELVRAAAAFNETGGKKKQPKAK